GSMKMPDPIMLPTTRATQLHRPIVFLVILAPLSAASRLTALVFRLDQRLDRVPLGTEQDDDEILDHPDATVGPKRPEPQVLKAGHHRIAPLQVAELMNVHHGRILRIVARAVLSNADAQ